MPLRVIKIILPQAHGPTALELLKKQENLNFWTEETSASHFVVSALTDSGRSEAIMDEFEKQFGSIDDFRIILFPVEGAIPRLDTENNNASGNSEISEQVKEQTRLRISREELYTDIVDSAKLSIDFVYMAILSTIVAAIGLKNDNVAVIIGAMVIAPFLGPNVALALSTNLADKKLGFDALKTLVSGVCIVLILSIIMGRLFNISPHASEIASRTSASVSDIILAIASGCAGVFAFTTGASSTVIGVMVAVAILPPLTVCGMLIGSGYFPQAASAFLLFMTNIICINLSGVATFFAQGVSPRLWWEADKAKKSTWKALLIWTGLLAVLIGIIIKL